ncbi:unnamed protein product [Peronospora belbahrii]|uniref:Uncharacterized protein n=1 Tax=Peronospora belbahrii TaxID=622444 RepID=A0ABN8CN89_9STRA|nr:unnamed protein product [Peronospora belbahrii]
MVTRCQEVDATGSKTFREDKTVMVPCGSMTMFGSWALSTHADALSVSYSAALGMPPFAKKISSDDLKATQREISAEQAVVEAETLRPFLY